MKRLSYAVLAVTALFALLWPSTTGAASPRMPSREALPSREFHGVIDCGTFQDNFVDFFSATLTTFFDANGDPSRLVFQVEHHSNDVNSVTGLAIHEHGHFTDTVDLATGIESVTGNSEVANRPGVGVVVQDVGRAVFDANGNLVFFAGGRNHSELFGGDQVLCDALA